MRIAAKPTRDHTAKELAQQSEEYLDQAITASILTPTGQAYLNCASVYASLAANRKADEDKKD